MVENKEPMLINKMLCVFLLITSAAWEEDFEHAQSKANESEKYILVYFSGSDWCANCFRLKKSVLEDVAFTTFAEENLVLYNADFPRKKKNQLSTEKQNTNNELAKRYNKDSVFPKVVLIDGKGNLVQSFDAIDFQKGAKPFITQVQSRIQK